MPLSEGTERAAWENLLRQPHMVEVECDLLSVMAEAQAEGTLPEPDPEPWCKLPEDECPPQGADLTRFTPVSGCEVHPTGQHCFCIGYGEPCCDCGSWPLGQEFLSE